MSPPHADLADVALWHHAPAAPRTPAWSWKPPVNLRFVDCIWHVRGSVALPPPQTGDEAFDRLDPLFHETGTTARRWGDTLTFEKTDPAAQDKMSVFDTGTLRIERDPTGPVLRYHLVSRALLFCFLAPFMFLAFAQLIIVINAHQKTKTETSAKAKPAKPEVKAPRPLNPIDKFLGAPAPEKPKKDEAGGGRKRKPTPTPAYVIAGMFAFLYVVGRILEDRLVKRLFQRRLSDA